MLVTFSSFQLTRFKTGILYNLKYALDAYMNDVSAKRLKLKLTGVRPKSQLMVHTEAIKRSSIPVL